MRSGNNKSFGQTNLSEFYDALTNVRLGKINTDAEIWISENDFCNGIPIEFLRAVKRDEFSRLLHDYNKNALDFLDKNQLFYLTIMEG